MSDGITNFDCINGFIKDYRDKIDIKRRAQSQIKELLDNKFEIYTGLTSDGSLCFKDEAKYCLYYQVTPRPIIRYDEHFDQLYYFIRLLQRPAYQTFVKDKTDAIIDNFSVVDVINIDIFPFPVLMAYRDKRAMLTDKFNNLDILCGDDAKIPHYKYHVQNK